MIQTTYQTMKQLMKPAMDKTMNQIGLSLPYAYLAGREDAPFYHAFGSVDKSLALFKKHGVYSIEIRAIGPATDAMIVMKIAHQIWDAGFELTVHGELPVYPVKGDDLSVIFPALHMLSEPLRKRGQIAMVPLHAYQQVDGDGATLADQSVASLKQLVALCEKQEQPYRFAVELNRSKKTVDPAVTYEGVLDIHDRVAHPLLGICWDFGHTYSNVSRGLLAPVASASFVENVCHTHIHDLSETGVTHSPLTEHRLPLQAYVTLLKDAGYQGVWNLELSPERFVNQTSTGQRILESIQVLKDSLQ